MAPPAHNRWGWSTEEDAFLEEQPTLRARAAAQQLGRSVIAVRNRRLILRGYQPQRTPPSNAPRVRPCADCSQPNARRGPRCARCRVAYSRIQARARDATRRHGQDTTMA